MTAFRYKAVDAAGRSANGVIEASSPLQAREALRARALLPVAISESQARMKGGVRTSQPRFRPAISGKLIAQTTRQLATLLANDIRLEDALLTVSRHIKSARAAAILHDIRKHVIEGHSFAEALAAQGNAFPEHYRASVAAGERAGRLDTVLAHLADYLDGRQTNQQTVQLALMYPAFLALVSGGIITLLLTNVVPDIVKVYRRREEALPFLTEILIALSDFLSTSGVWLLAAMVVAAIGARWAMSIPRFRLKVDRSMLRLPAFGHFAANRDAAQFSGTLAMLVQSGVPLVDAMRVSAKVLNNRYVRAQMIGAAADVSEGAPLERALEKADCLPPMFLAMISGATRSGELGAVLARTASDQQRELDARVKAIVAMVEPLVLLLMGGIVLLVVMAILSPIVNLNRMTGL